MSNTLTQRPKKAVKEAAVKKPRKIFRILKWFLGSLLVLMIAFAGFIHYKVTTKVKEVLNLEVKFGEDLAQYSDADFTHKPMNEVVPIDESTFAKLEEPSPFREISAFDDDAKSWGTFNGQYGACGLLLADVNNDDRIDAYFLNPGENWVRPTDEKGVLLDEPRLQHNALFLNMGNDENGDPIFLQAKEIAKSNETFVEEELLVENYLYPRKSAEDSEKRVGRTSKTAVSVDLNGDGLKDLIVGNGLEGMLWSEPETQRVMGQFVRPIGRQANNVQTPMISQGLGFIDGYRARDNREDKRKSSRGEEYCGANSVFLNMGDKDNDGLPEWKDITKETGLAGQRNTYSILAADFDLDGDVDIFEGNAMDEDFWPGGATAIAGACNQLYINQLAETGELKFIEKSAEMNVDGLYDEDNPMPAYHRLKKRPFLPTVYSIAFRKWEEYHPEWLTLNGQESEHAQISWTSIVQDANHDGYPDIWVANDLGWLRLYLNDKGKGFISPEKYARSKQTGSWMSFSPGDFNGDLHEDLFAGNVGGSSMNTATSIPDPHMMFDPVMVIGTVAQQYYSDNHRAMHAVISGENYEKEFKTRVKHSKILPPDTSIPNNVKSSIPGGRLVPYDINSLDPYEFTWGSTTVDVQNDGKKDIYWIGCLYGSGGGIFPLAGAGPGRLLVNATKSGEELNFVDLTAEYQAFNILELNYDKLKTEGYIYRKSPTKNWGKRSMVYSYDKEVWALQGPGVLQKVANHSMIQTSEEGRSVVAADINNDGFQDIVLRNLGGYDSRKSDAVNLKAKINGKVQVLPAHDANFPTPTNFEPGDARVFINTHSNANFIKVKLVDNTAGSFNKDAVGAKVIINDKHLMICRVGGGGFLSNYQGPLEFGLGEEKATKIKIQWPDKSQTEEVYNLEDLSNGILVIEKNKGVVKWDTL